MHTLVIGGSRGIGRECVRYGLERGHRIRALVVLFCDCSFAGKVRGCFDARSVHIHPLGRREIRSFTQHLFPGLEIPESVARRLRR